MLPRRTRKTEIEVMFDLQNWLLRNNVITENEAGSMHDFRSMTLEDYIQYADGLLKHRNPYLRDYLPGKVENFIKYEKRKI